MPVARIRVSDADLRRYREAGAAERLTVSGWLRRAAGDAERFETVSRTPAYGIRPDSPRKAA